jgi:cysteine desulfurase/selenocysteine lyase
MTSAQPALSLQRDSADNTAAFDVARIRKDFPILHQQVHGKPLVYLDNAASSQKPQSVIDAVAHFDSHDYSNIHRGVHDLSQRATVAYEEARVKAQRFLNASHDKEIIFVRGATEAINLVAHSYGRTVLNLGDEILISANDDRAHDAGLELPNFDVNMRACSLAESSCTSLKHAWQVPEARNY